MLVCLTWTDFVLDFILICLLRNAFGVDDLLKHVDHVVKLTVNVTDDDHWLLDLEEIGLAFYSHQTQLRNLPTFHLSVLLEN